MIKASIKDCTELPEWLKLFDSVLSAELNVTRDKSFASLARTSMGVV